MKAGMCRECFGNVPMTEETRVALDVDIWECPECDYPNDYGDMHMLFSMTFVPYVVHREWEGEGSKSA